MAAPHPGCHRGLIAGQTRDLRDLFSSQCGQKKAAVRSGQAADFLWPKQIDWSYEYPIFPSICAANSSQHQQE